MNIEDLKCCGNCKSRCYLGQDKYFEEWCSKMQKTSSCEYCDKWEYDNLYKYQRKIIYKEKE